MSVNSIAAATQNAATYQISTSKNGLKDKVSAWDEEDNTSAKARSGEAAVYEPSTSARSYKTDTEMVAQLKAEAEQRTESLRNLVEKMINQQTNTFADASGDNLWAILRSGNFAVDEETKKQAQADIADDGYWGVEQTSDRIVKYATALTGGDPEKLESMIQAFEKGYAEAEKTWGGTLPDLAQRTREAVLSKFEDLKKEYGLIDDEE